MSHTIETRTGATRATLVRCEHKNTSTPYAVTFSRDGFRPTVARFGTCSGALLAADAYMGGATIQDATRAGHDQDAYIDRAARTERAHERDYGGAFDGFTVTSDADPGL